MIHFLIAGSGDRINLKAQRSMQQVDLDTCKPLEGVL
jgi:hypothetical protein